MIATTMAGTVTVAEVAANVSATEVAVTVTIKSLAGGVDGALYVTEVVVELVIYVTEVVVELVRVPAPDAGERLQVTPLCAGSP